MAGPMMEYIGRITGQPPPNVPWEKMGSGQGLMQRYQGLLAAGASPEQANAAIFGIKPTKPAEERVPWTSPTGAQYMLKPGEAARADVSAFFGPQRVGIAQAGLDLRGQALAQQERHFQEKQETETTKPMSPTEVADFTANSQKRLDSAKGAEETAEITRQIKEQGGDVKTVTVPAWPWGTKQKSIVVPPSVKVQTKRPAGGAPGFLGGGAPTYEQFKAAYAKNPAAAIAASQKAGDGFAERLKKESGQ